MTILTKLTGVRLADLIAKETPLPALYIQHVRFGKFDPTASWEELNRELLWMRFERKTWFNILCDHLYVLWRMLKITDQYVGNYHGGDRSKAKELRLRIEKTIHHVWEPDRFDYDAILDIKENPRTPMLNTTTLDLVRKLMLDVVRSDEVKDPKSQALRRLKIIERKCNRVAFKERTWQRASGAYPFEWSVPGRKENYFMIPGGEAEHPPGWGALTRFGANQIYHQDLANQEGPNREATEDVIRDYVARLVRVDPAWTRPNSAARPQIAFLMLLGNVEIGAMNIDSFRSEIDAFQANSRIVGNFVGSTVGEWNYLFAQLVEPEPEPERFGASTPIPAAVPKKTLPKESRGSTARAQYLLQAQRDLPELPEDEPEPEPTVVIPEEHDPPTWVEPVTAKVAKPETSMLPLLAVGAVAAVILVR